MNSLQWIIHQSEHRVNNTLNRWLLAHRWSLCGDSDKGFGSKWMVTWSGNQKLCCSWGHLHCHANCGFYIKGMLLQQGSSGWGVSALQMSANLHHTSARLLFVYPLHFFIPMFFCWSFLESATYFIVWWILHVLFPDFWLLSSIRYSINFISINQHSQENLPMELYEKKLFSWH